jgi:hypothetical protein
MNGEHKKIARETAVKLVRELVEKGIVEVELDHSISVSERFILSAITKATEALEDKMCELIEDTKITEPEGNPVSRLASLCSWAKLRRGEFHAASQHEWSISDDGRVIMQGIDIIGACNTRIDAEAIVAAHNDAALAKRLQDESE